MIKESPDNGGEPTLGDKLRNAVFVIVGLAISIWWIVAQILATGAGCWFWPC